MDTVGEILLNIWKVGQPTVAEDVGFYGKSRFVCQSSERIDRSGRNFETENIGSKPKLTPPLEQEIHERSMPYQLMN